ncbi:MAG: hypothetical protein ACRDIC_08280 [bacterium]
MWIERIYDVRTEPADVRHDVRGEDESMDLGRRDEQPVGGGV